ncbi:LytR/AlgR family response regulator transcription factor [Nocardioides nitrophenolicus]|uniref:LytR/AlgR family response regulator transcription factor n=1 Tax=Nocardioides nitrophenolicus TaxID=60489 RepID=UPI00195935B7|nr:LytTR family DNA-binding domain-containing protein [Nocardioides nitrophenolicus]MBM7517243.1 DNA-binding LytR/AlgR family response regulator [Nocardioides nitrophenolicus]
MSAPGGGLRVLVVDDERPALDELSYLLDADDRVGEVIACQSATDGLRILREREVDCVFLDIQMPGLTGLELAEVLGRFKQPPPVVFVTAHEQHAVDAFDLHAVDYVLKPVRPERLAEAVRRVLGGASPAPAAADAQVAVERGGVTRFVDRADITHVEAQGDYARLHTIAGDGYLVRVPLTTLEEEWAEAGFHRIHRSLLVALAHVTEVRSDAGRTSVVVGGRSGGTELPVSRRHTRGLRDVLVRRARAGG